MSLRRKMLLAMAASVLVMAAVFYLIFYGYVRGLFQFYAANAERDQAQQWAHLLAYEYTQAGSNWTGAQAFVTSVLQENSEQASSSSGERVTVYDASGKLVAAAEEADPREEQNPYDPQQDAQQATRYPITVDGRQVGSVAVGDSGLLGLYAMEQSVLRSMTAATAWGLALTAAAAIAFGVWMASRFTGPLRRLLAAIHRFTAGDRSVRVVSGARDEVGELATAFNSMAERLEAAEQSRRRLMADVAHELRTPLTIMQGRLELIQEGVEAPDRNAVIPILDELIRLTGLVDDLHQLALADSGVLPLHRQRIDLADLLRRIVDNFTVQAEEASVRLRLQEPAGLTAADGLPSVLIDGDSHRLTQVFVNLLGNAIRYTPADGEVTVGWSVERRIVRIDVADTGPGIAPEHLPHIFDRFYRVDEDRSRSGGGMGIGLAISKGFVEAHGGRILAFSQLGEGTRFTIELPLLPP